MLVRREELSIVNSDASDGVEGELLGRRFFGHDVLQQVRLSSGCVVEVRSTGPAIDSGGNLVRVVLRSAAYRVFRRDETTTYTARRSVNPA